MKKVTMMFVFAFLMVSILSVSLAEAAKPKKAEKGGSNSALESNLKTYFSEKIPYANITAVKVIKVGDVVSVKRRQVLTNKIIEDLERPVLVNITGKCLYSATIINENVRQVLHKNEWGEWAIGQGTQTEDSIVSGMLSATFDVQKCPENPESIAQRKREKEAEVAKKEAKIAAEEAAERKSFITNADGTVTDTRAGIVWASKSMSEKIDWINAKSYCENYRGGGWRMPTRDELIALSTVSDDILKGQFAMNREEDVSKCTTACEVKSGRCNRDVTVWTSDMGVNNARAYSCNIRTGTCGEKMLKLKTTRAYRGSCGDFGDYGRAIPVRSIK